MITKGWFYLASLTINSVPDLLFGICFASACLCIYVNIYIFIELNKKWQKNLLTDE